MKKIFSSIVLFLLIGFSVSANSLYKAKAVASFYANDFHGKKTSNGEIFNMWAMTCAHKMLPFNTILKVTNLANGKSVQVRVNDRGPFVKSREIDLSKGAANKIGMIGAGIANVRLEIVKLGKYTKDSVVTAKKACQMAGIQYKQVKINTDKVNVNITQTNKTSSKDLLESLNNIEKRESRWDIQLASFSARENAIKFGQEIKKLGFENVIMQKTSEYTRIALKDIPQDEVEKYIVKLQQAGIYEYTVKERKK